MNDKPFLSTLTYEQKMALRLGSWDIDKDKDKDAVVAMDINTGGDQTGVTIVGPGDERRYILYGGGRGCGKTASFFAENED